MRKLISTLSLLLALLAPSLTWASGNLTCDFDVEVTSGSIIGASFSGTVVSVASSGGYGGSCPAHVGNHYDIIQPIPSPLIFRGDVVRMRYNWSYGGDQSYESWRVLDRPQPFRIVVVLGLLLGLIALAVKLRLNKAEDESSDA